MQFAFERPAKTLRKQQEWQPGGWRLPKGVTVAMTRLLDPIVPRLLTRFLETLEGGSFSLLTCLWVRSLCLLSLEINPISLPGHSKSPFNPQNTMKTHAFPCFSCPLLLLLLCCLSVPTRSFVPRAPSHIRTVTSGLQQLKDHTEQDSSTPETSASSPSLSSPSAEESDYLLQTGDYSILSDKPEDHDSPHHPNWHARFQPRVAWDHHHQATVRLVRPQHPSVRPQQHSYSSHSQVDINTDPHAQVPPQPQETTLPGPATATPDEENRASKLFQNILQGNNSNNSKRHPLLVSSTQEWKNLEQHAEAIQDTHLRDLLKDAERSDALYATHDGVYLDYARQRVTLETMQLLQDLARKQNLQGKMKDMRNGEKINFTEDRAVLHTALRAARDHPPIPVDENGLDAIQEVHQVLDQIQSFTDGVRSGEIRGYTGKRLRNIVSVGIGGSYLGPEFLHECLKTEPDGIHASLGYSLRFLSNVDPVDVERTCADLDPEETLIVIVSKTFTTAETMLNARTMRQWLWDFMGNDPGVVQKHMVACASISSKEKVEDFGIDTNRYFFRFWDWVGGRYSVCSAAGAVPISLLYGFDLFQKFLDGARSMDDHFFSAPMKKNIPVIMGLLGVWNMSFLNYKSRVTLPYAEALLKLPAHIQQLDMESNGKSVTKDGLTVDYPVGEIDFGEAGTNGQHSFYQLLHMGQTVPSDFIGFCESQHDFCVDGESLSSHDELMANFFAQPDALACGKTAEEVRAEGEENEANIPHRVFEGNRPSLSLLLPKLTAYACGQLLALYEHRTAVQGFIWDINSFDQFGVELGKKLALNVKDSLLEGRTTGQPVQDAGSHGTTRLLNYYLQESRNACAKDSNSGNPFTKVTRHTHHDQPPIRHDLGGLEGKL